MQTRRDQLHAYRFMTRRAMSSLLTGEPDAIEPPMRRLTVMTLSGIMIAIVVAAVFAVIGLLKGGGGDGWRSEGAVVIEEETGARYVNIGGTLFPVLNYASAVLASGAGSEVTLQQVSRGDLASAEVGDLIGIGGLPDSMPEVDDLVRGPISVCSQSVSEGIDTVAEVVVAVGRDEDRPAVSDGIYVESFDGDRFLLLGGERLPVDEAVEAALQINEEPVKVGSAFLTAIPMGASLETPSLDGQGAPVVVGGQTLFVGQLIAVDDGTFRVVMSDGLARVSDVQAKLLRTALVGGQRRDPIDMSLSQVLDLGEGAGLGGAMAGLPEVMPELSTEAGTLGGVCAMYADGEPLPEFVMPEGAAAGEPSAESKESKLGMADKVLLDPGEALLAQSPSEKVVYFLGAPGRVYPAKDMQTLGGFGYAEVDPARFPAELISIIPAGPALDPGAARATAQ